MDTSATVSLTASPEQVYAAVADLGGYASWSGIVHSARPTATADDTAPTWIVDLRAGVGPFTRSKRLRMVRVADEPPRRCVFERHEDDDRDHAMWRLTCTVATTGDATALTMHLHYGGRLWTGGVLERTLEQEVSEAARRLRSMLEAPPTR
jgi:uncharacterized protein YndB with AHSA1/START domain